MGSGSIPWLLFFNESPPPDHRCVCASMLSMVMASMAQLTVSSLSSSGATAQRQRIEGAINDNMQLIYQADIRLEKSFETNKTSLQSACEFPAAFLASALDHSG